MRNLIRVLVIALSSLIVSACLAQPLARQPLPVRLAEITDLSRQGLSDQALIDLVEQRGLAFTLAPNDESTLLAAGVSEGVIRYLQGRAAGERDALRSLAQRRAYLRTYNASYYDDPFLRGYYGHLVDHHHDGHHRGRH